MPYFVYNMMHISVSGTTQFIYSSNFRSVTNLEQNVKAFNIVA